MSSLFVHQHVCMDAYQMKKCTHLAPHTEGDIRKEASKVTVLIIHRIMHIKYSLDGPLNRYGSGADHRKHIKTQ